MGVRRGAGVVVAAAVLALLTSAPADAAALDQSDVPRVKVKIESIRLASYSGSVAVLAHVKCTPKVDGVGTASWSVKAHQPGVRARGEAAIPCDGKKRLVGMRLVPRSGAFESGLLDVELDTLAEGTSGAVATGTFFTTPI